MNIYIDNYLFYSVVMAILNNNISCYSCFFHDNIIIRYLYYYVILDIMFLLTILMNYIILINDK